MALPLVTPAPPGALLFDARRRRTADLVRSVIQVTGTPPHSKARYGKKVCMIFISKFLEIVVCAGGGNGSEKGQGTT